MTMNDSIDFDTELMFAQLRIEYPDPFDFELMLAQIRIEIESVLESLKQIIHALQIKFQEFLESMKLVMNDIGEFLLCEIVEQPKNKPVLAEPRYKYPRLYVRNNQFNHKRPLNGRRGRR